MCNYVLSTLTDHGCSIKLIKKIKPLSLVEKAKGYRLYDTVLDASYSLFKKLDRGNGWCKDIREEK